MFHSGTCFSLGISEHSIFVVLIDLEFNFPPFLFLTFTFLPCIFIGADHVSGEDDSTPDSFIPAYKA